MKKSTKEKLTVFNEWMATAPDIEIDGNDIGAITEDGEMTVQELKAIRLNLRFDQVLMAKILGAKLATYQKWEGSANSVKVPLVPATLLRTFYSYPHLMMTRLKKPTRIK